MRRTRVRVSDERARLEWLATWNMGNQSTLIYSQSQMGKVEEEMVYKEWGRETTWKVQQVSHSDSLTCGACRGDKGLEVLLRNSYLLARHYDFVAHKITVISQASSKRLDVRNWTFLMRRLCCCGSQSNWHNCKLPPNQPPLVAPTWPCMPLKSNADALFKWLRFGRSLSSRISRCSLCMGSTQILRAQIGDRLVSQFLGHTGTSFHANRKTANNMSLNRTEK